MYNWNVSKKDTSSLVVEEAPKKLLNSKIKEVEDDILDDDLDAFLDKWQKKASEQIKLIDSEENTQNDGESSISSKDVMTVEPTIIDEREDSVLAKEIEMARLLHLQRVFGSRHQVEDEVWRCLTRCEHENGAMGLPTLQSSKPSDEGTFPLLDKKALDPLVRVPAGLIKERQLKAVEFSDSDFDATTEVSRRARNCVCGQRLENDSAHLDNCRVFRNMWEALLRKFIHDNGIPKVRRLLSRLAAHRLCNEEMALCALAQSNGDIDAALRRLASYEFRLEMHRVTKIHSIPTFLISQSARLGGPHYGGSLLRTAALRLR